MMMHVSRRLLGTALGLIAAAAAVWSVFLSWYSGRKGSNIRIQDLFGGGLSANSASTMNSLFLPLAFAALLVLIYAVLGWRWLPVLAGLLCLATPLLWGTRQAQTVDGLHAALVGHGPQLAGAAGVVLLIAAVLSPPRLRVEPEPVVEVVERDESTVSTRAADDDVAGADAYAAGYRDARGAVDSDIDTDADADTTLTPVTREPETEPGEATEELPRRERRGETTPAP